MAVHFFDYEIQKDIFSTPELKAIFEEKAKFQRWLDIEGALALTQGELGLIPLEAAQEISQKARLDYLDLEAVKKSYEVAQNSVLPIVKGLRNACSKGYGEFIHYGVTTQDIVDTGQVLELKQVLVIVQRDLAKIEIILMEIAQKHCETPMIGRTHGQYALPITFGLKVAVWITEIRRHIERIKSLTPRVLVGQLSGAVGTRAALGQKAMEVSKRTLDKLGLNEQIIAWHTARDNIAEVCACFTMVTGTLAKIANEIFLLGRTDIREVKESPAAPNTMSSSTMPHKSNPVVSERIVVLFKHVRALLGIAMESMLHENERDPRSLWAEWLAFPQLAIYTGKALNYTIELLNGLEVYPQVMKKNLYRFGDFISSEYLLFKLGESIGKINAQEKLHQLVQLAKEQEITLKEALAKSEVADCFTKDDFDVLEHPEWYIGQAKSMVEMVLADK